MVCHIQNQVIMNSGVKHIFLELMRFIQKVIKLSVLLSKEKVPLYKNQSTLS